MDAHRGSNSPSRLIDLGKNDAVILAVPPYVATNLVPGCVAPSLFRGIVNAHFRVDPPAHLPPMLGVINGTCEWIFALPGRISATISDGGESVRHATNGVGADDMERYCEGRRVLRAIFRPGRSFVSGARLSPQRRSKMARRPISRNSRGTIFSGWRLDADRLAGDD